MSIRAARSLATSSMPAKRFLDTNIFVYSFSKQDERKASIARGLIEEGLTHQVMTAISLHVVHEFLNVATAKFVVPMSESAARNYMDDVLRPLCAVPTTLNLYGDALSIRAETQWSFYDCLIVAAAARSECELLYSEDLQHDRVVRGVRICDPFR